MEYGIYPVMSISRSDVDDFRKTYSAILARAKDVCRAGGCESDDYMFATLSVDTYCLSTVLIGM